MTMKPTTLTDILNQLAAIDYELQELEKRRTLAQSTANAAEVSRLEAHIAQLIETRNELRIQWKRQHRR
jgi:hypothetical protein